MRARVSAGHAAEIFPEAQRCYGRTRHRNRGASQRAGQDFLTASPEERAKRRYEELTQKGEKVSYEKVLQDMIARDKQDSERAIAPLRPAPDAVKLDTSGNTIEQSIAEILAIVRRKLG